MGRGGWGWVQADKLAMAAAGPGAMWSARGCYLVKKFGFLASGEVSRGEKMAVEGTDPESYITKYLSTLRLLEIQDTHRSRGLQEG